MRKPEPPPGPSLVEQRAALEALQVRDPFEDDGRADPGVTTEQALKTLQQAWKMPDLENVREQAEPLDASIKKIDGQLEAYGRLAFWDPKKRAVYHTVLIAGPSVAMTGEELAQFHRSIGEIEVTLEKAGLSVKDFTLKNSTLGEQRTRPATPEESAALKKAVSILTPMKAARGDSGYDEPLTDTVTIETLSRGIETSKATPGPTGASMSGGLY